jgi:hypothetical protein
MDHVIAQGFAEDPMRGYAAAVDDIPNLSQQLSKTLALLT